MARPPICNEGGGRAPAVNQRRLRREVAASKAPTIVVGEYFRVNRQFVGAASNAGGNRAEIPANAVRQRC